MRYLPQIPQFSKWWFCKFDPGRVIADSTAVQQFNVQRPSLPSGFHPRYQVSILALRFLSWCWQASLPALRFPSWPSGLSPRLHRHLRLPLEGLWTREVQPDVSTGGLLSAYPTHISEFQERILKNPMTNARPARPLPLTTLLDFHIVCIMVRWALSFSRSNYNLEKKFTVFFFLRSRFILDWLMQQYCRPLFLWQTASKQQTWVLVTWAKAKCRWSF